MIKSEPFTVRQNLATIFKSKLMIVLFIASTFRFLGEYTMGFWAVRFFTFNYPENQFSYVMSKLFINAILCVLSNFIGGLIADKFES